MTASFKSKPERTGLSTQDLPTIPTVQEMKTWDREKVLRWIQQRAPEILIDGDLKKFNKSGITGRAFSVSSFNFFEKSCGLSPRASLALEDLVGEIKEGKFFP
jgi:hypothetical protein